jgi:hypothetical protein
VRVAADEKREPSHAELLNQVRGERRERLMRLGLAAVNSEKVRRVAKAK